MSDDHTHDEGPDGLEDDLTEDDFVDPMVFAPLPGLSLILDTDEDEDFVVTAIEPGVGSREWIFDDPVIAASHLGALAERVMAEAPILNPPEDLDGAEPLSVRPLAEVSYVGSHMAILRFAEDGFVLASESWDEDDWLGLPSFSSAVVSAITIAIEDAVESALSATGAGSLDDLDVQELAALAGVDLTALDDIDLAELDIPDAPDASARPDETDR